MRMRSGNLCSNDIHNHDYLVYNVIVITFYYEVPVPTLSLLYMFTMNNKMYIMQIC